MNHIYDMIIIGGGPAGYTSALYAARAGLDTLVVEYMAPGGQMVLTDIIDNYPGFDEGVEGFSLSMRMQKGAERFGAKTLYDKVLSVDFSEKIKKINLSNQSLLAKTVVIATGANPRELGLDNEKRLTGRGVHYCAHCDGRFYKDKTVLVVGGGNTAVSDALHLSRIAKKVYIVHRRDSLKATKLYHQPLMAAENVEFLWNSTLTEIMGDERASGARVKNLLNDSETIVECNGIFISIGRTPATDFLENSLNLDENKYIIADETTKTNINGVYAVGDVRTKVLRQVVTAVADGANAVHFAEEYLAE